MKILSTKILTLAQKELLAPLDIELTEYEAISISYLPFDMPEDFDYYLITSQNAVRSLLAHLKSAANPQDIFNKSAFCVGVKTSALLGRSGFHVAHYEDNAEALGRYLVAQQPDHSYLFLCGDRRREELPKLLHEHTVPYQEKIVYETSLNAITLETQYDGYLFFSPSAVKSFALKNRPETGTSYCIGHTTAEAANQLGLPVSVANTPTVESVLALLIQNSKE